MATKDGGSRVNRRTFLKAAGAAGAAVSIAGCTGGEEITPTEQPGNTDEPTPTKTAEEPSEFAVTITQGQLDSGLDPHDHRETTTDIVLMQAYEGGLDRDPKGRVIASLADDWERIAEGHVRLHVREGVKFHSGETLTPEDVAFSYNRIIDPDVGGLARPQSDQLAGVTGASVVDGEHAVDVRSESVNPIVFGLLASYGDIMQQSWVEAREKSEINAGINGTGPFALQKYEQDVEVVYEAFADYWRGPPAVTELTMNATKESSTRVNQLVSGETDVIVNVPPQDVSRIQQNQKTRLEAVPSTRIIFNPMRYDVEPFSNVKFRQAMNYAVDLESIVKNVLSGFADTTGQPTLEGFVGYNPDVDPYPYDPAKAEALVEESGHAGVTIELHTPVGRYLKDLEIAQAVAGYIDELPNVNCTAKQRDFGALVSELLTGKVEDKPHFFLIGWGNETFDASQTMIPWMTTGGSITTYKEDDRMDGYMADSQTEADPQKRSQLLMEANEYAHDVAPWVFLNRQYSVYGVSERVEWTARRDESIKAYAMTPK